MEGVTLAQLESIIISTSLSFSEMLTTHIEVVCIINVEIFITHARSTNIQMN